MGGRISWKVVAVALGLPSLALVIAAVVLILRGNDVAPITITPPSTTEAVVQPPTPTVEIRVHVSGAVAFPNVYSMGSNDRVMDAIAAAGGPTANANLTAINLAQRVRDEEHYHIPALGEAAATSPLTGKSSTAPRVTPDGPINLNRASPEQLESLPGIGPALAAAIVEYRQRDGPFATVDDITEVPGVGPKTLEKIRDLVTVSGAP